MKPLTPIDQSDKLQRVVIKGNPSDEEQALILARIHAMHVSSDASHPALALAKKPIPWIQAARSEQLNRWPQSTEDRYWHL